MSPVGTGSAECVVLDAVPPHAIKKMQSPKAIALNLVIRDPFHRVGRSGRPSRSEWRGYRVVTHAGLTFRGREMSSDCSETDSSGLDTRRSPPFRNSDLSFEDRRWLAAYRTNSTRLEIPSLLKMWNI